MLQFYWSLGKDIVTLRAESRWGDKFIASLSADLKTKLPGVKGLSETSIGYAKRFYLLYNKRFTIHPNLRVNYKSQCCITNFLLHRIKRDVGQTALRFIWQHRIPLGVQVGTLTEQSCQRIGSDIAFRLYFYRNDSVFPLDDKVQLEA